MTHTRAHIPTHTHTHTFCIFGKGTRDTAVATAFTCSSMYAALVQNLSSLLFTPSAVSACPATTECIYDSLTAICEWCMPFTAAAQMKHGMVPL